MENVHRTIPSFTQSTSSPKRKNELIISPKLGNNSTISPTSTRTHSEISPPWIPVIGLVCPEESVLYKELTHTFNCSSNEEAQITKDDENTDHISSSETKYPSEKQTSNHENQRENKMVDVGSDKNVITYGDKTQIFGLRTNEDTIKEILYNSIVLEKIMQHWRDTLNQQSEILSQGTQVKTNLHTKIMKIYFYNYFRIFLYIIWR